MDSGTSSGRRKAPQQSPNLALIAIVTVIAIIILVMVLGSRRKREDPPSTAALPTAAPSKPAQSPTETVPPTDLGMADTTDFQDEADAEPLEQATTPSVTGCVKFSWQAELKPGAEDPIPVEITITNGCDFEVDCASIVFEVVGIRTEETVRTMTGAYQGNLDPGESALVTITLPGDDGGYERLKVAIPN